MDVNDLDRQARTPDNTGPGRQAAPGTGRLVSFQEAIARLGVAPHTFRQIYTQFYDALEPVAGGPITGVSERNLELLQKVVEWRNAGYSHDEIRRRLTAARLPGQEGPGETGATTAMAPYNAALPGTGQAEAAAARETPAVVLSPAQGEALLKKIEELKGQLARSEERRTEDRDRLVTLIMRTQMEIQHLRYELAASQSRRERHRGFWRRLFGN